MVLKSTALHSACSAEVAADDEELGRSSSVSLRATRGLVLRKGIWHIDKVVYGQRICESTEAGHPWLADAPLIPVRRSVNPREPYPLSVGEQQLLFSELQEPRRILELPGGVVGQGSSAA
jgi:hypothetical protein